MNGFAGRKITLTWNGASIPGVREKGLTLNGEPIDTSDDDSSGFRELADESGENTLDISISGVSKDQTLRKAWMDGLTTPAARIGAVVITWPDGSSVSGQMRLNNHQETGPYKDAATFQSALQSTGAISYTAAA